MKRAKAKQHLRKTKSGKTVIVNKGVAKKAGTKKVQESTYNKGWEKYHDLDYRQSKAQEDFDKEIEKLKFKKPEDLKSLKTSQQKQESLL